MTEKQTDDATQGDESQSAEGTAGSPEQSGTDAAAQIASYRKRQAGAEAARQTAESKLAEAQKQLEVYETANRSASDQDLANVAKLQERVQAAETRASEAEAKAEQRILDAKYPNARKELPEVIDEIRLAKFEALLADGEDFVPEPQRHNESRTAGAGSGTAKPETADEVEARLLAMPSPW